jgi:hypothetical protein
VFTVKFPGIQWDARNRISHADRRVSKDRLGQTEILLLGIILQWFKAEEIC